MKLQLAISGEIAAVSLWKGTRVVYGASCMYTRRKGRPLPYFMILSYDRPGASPSWTWKRGRGLLANMPGQQL